MHKRPLALSTTRLCSHTDTSVASVVTSSRTLTRSSPPPSRHTCTSSAPDGGCGDQFSPAAHQPSAAPAQLTLPSNGAPLGTALGDALGSALGATLGDALGDTLGDGVAPS